jgi:uncharacterized protein YkwD
VSRLTRRLLPLLVATFVAGAWLSPLTAQPVAAREGSTFVSKVNSYRAAAGVGPVSLHSVVDKIAAERADQLAADRALGHDMEYVKKRLAQTGVCWERLGEIVAYNWRSEADRIDRFVYQWYNSDGHRKVMLGSAYTHAGGSYTTASNGAHYAAMIFIDLCGASATAPAPAPSTSLPFTDIANSKFRNDIVWIANEKITYGCSETKYCPDGLVLRDQMTTFLSRAMTLPGASKNYFSDTWGNKHRDNINRAAEAGLTYGCDGTRFCPSGRVTRAQMASFLSRALNLPRATRDYFWDDNGNRHEDAINRIAQAGITVGCDAGRYCPGGAVTRGQMAAFLRRSFD